MSSPEFTVHRHFADGHADLCEVIPHCGFDLHFSKVNNTEHLSMYFLAFFGGQCTSSLEKYLSGPASHFLIGLFFVTELHGLFILIYFEDESLVSCSIISTHSVG